MYNSDWINKILIRFMIYGKRLQGFINFFFSIFSSPSNHKY